MRPPHRLNAPGRRLQAATRSPGERGQALAVVALLIAVFGGMTAMAIDLGSYATERRDLQNAADAIALAAAQELPDAAATRSMADVWAGKNGIDPATMTVTVIPQSASEPNPKVRVELEDEHEFTFARLVGIESAPVGALAEAIKTSPGGSGELMPWSVKEEVKQTADPGEPLVLKYDANNVDTGNFGALALDGSGANEYRDAIKYGSDSTYCADGVLDCDGPSVVDSEPGNMTGPTRTATDYRINNTSADCDTWEEVVVVAADGTHGLTPECNPFTNGGNSYSLRVIIIPIISGEFRGRSEMTIVEFALFFLEGYGDGGCSGNSCEIKGRFIRSNTNYGAVTGVFDEDTLVHFVRLVR
jgi:hypothetical protein